MHPCLEKGKTNKSLGVYVGVNLKVFFFSKKAHFKNI